MIRRISKNNDLKDLIKSCPSGVIDDITEIRYFISGHPETEIVATFEKVGSHLEAILPTSELSTLSNGVLMRRALYKVSDPAYPDGYYNLEFVDNLDVWLGDEDVTPTPPGPDDYLTPDDLKTINNQSIVGQGNITIEASVPDYYATKSWVSEQGYTNIEEVGQYLYAYAYATEDWVRGQEYLSSIPSEYVTQSWLSSHNYMTEDDVRWILGGEGEDNPVMREEDLSYYATMNWVLDQGYITSAGISGLATQSWVLSQGYITSETLPEDIATQSWVESYISECGFAGMADVDALSRWVVSQNYATESWVSSQQFATQSWVSLQGYLTSVPSEYATQSWVSSQNFLTSTSLTGYATMSWVESHGYITSAALSGYATESWVEYFVENNDQNPCVRAEDFDFFLSYGLQDYGFATQSWVSSNFLSTTALTGYATESWVSSQQFITSTALTGYATESWVQSQGYLTSHQNLSSYATKSWVSANYVNETEVWTGTTAQWNTLTSAQKATYKIALITE